MRRLILLLLCLILTVGTVSAADRATSIQSAATANPDGSCQVTVIAAIHLDKGRDGLSFPLPAEARNIKLNNTKARVIRTEDAAEVFLDKITGGSAGDFTLTFSYSLDSVVREEKELGQVMTLPLLYGFSLPVEQLEFSVTLPGPFDTRPTFSSGYLQQSIESSITYSINGATINGVLSVRLQDHETLTMQLLAPEGLFSPVITRVQWDTPFQLAVGLFALLALLYWLIALRAMPLRRTHCTTPPEGITAGELGCRLSMQKADLTMMVLSWAQLGYLLITMDENGRVFLHRRMEMGNERSAFENHYFRTLFRKSRVVDGTGYRYAKLCRKAASENPSGRGGFLPSSGNPFLMRILCAAAGAAAGAALGCALAGSMVWQILLLILLGAAAVPASWQIQGLMQSLHLRRTRSPWAGLGILVLWLLLGLLSGQLPITAAALIIQLLGGLMAAYGGRRSERGRQVASEILGLRHYLKTVSKDELQRILGSNPDYYYELAPYALALGVDKAFAQRFQQLRQPNCTYLMTNLETKRTALDWYGLLREVADTLDARQKHMKLEKLTR